MNASQCHVSLQRNSNCKIIPFFDNDSEEMVKQFSELGDDRIFFPYSFPHDYSFDYPAELELISYSVDHEDYYLPSDMLLKRFNADKDGIYGDNYFMHQYDRIRIVEILIETLIHDLEDNIPASHADFMFHFASELEARIPEILKKFADALIAMYPNKRVRVGATTWGAESPESSAGFYISYIFYNIHKIDEEDTKIFLPPTTNLDGHGKQAKEWDILSDDAETDKYLKEIINQFSDSPLYNDAFTSKDLIEFVERSNGFIGVSEVHAYNADDALSEALDILIQDYRDVVEDVSDIRFIIYVGSNFEEKENLLSRAKYAIKKRLMKEFDNDIDIKVAIAQCDNLCGGGDLILHALS